MGRAVPARARRGLAVSLVALAGVLLGVELGGQVTHDLGPFSTEFSVRPSLTGDSRLQVPPLGAVTVDSHDGPLRLDARVGQLDPGETQRLVADPRRIEQAGEDAVTDAEDAVAALALRTTGAAVLGALLLGLVVFRRVRQAVLSGLVALALVLAGGAAAVLTFSPESIREPRYEGLLVQAPAVVGDARDITDRYAEYRGELIRIVTTMGRIYTTLSTLPVYEDGSTTTRVLHVSDLHLNPISYEVIGSVAQQFKVAAVVDTGDLTDWGSEPENRYVDAIGRLRVPYVFVRGNHDSTVTAASVARQRNATVLDGQVAEVAGLTVAGIGDPRFTPDKTTGDARAAADDEDGEVVRESGRRLAEIVERSGAEPDLLLVHDPRSAEPLADSGPLVLAGHIHRRDVRELDDDTRLMVQGSTGARGLRGLQEDEPTPLALSVLYLGPDGALQAYDDIQVSGAGRSTVTLERTVVTEVPRREGAPSPTPR